jgi:hypothetical protein
MSALILGWVSADCCRFAFEWKVEGAQKILCHLFYRIFYHRHLLLECVCMSYGKFTQEDNAKLLLIPPPSKNIIFCLCTCLKSSRRISAWIVKCLGKLASWGEDCILCAKRHEIKKNLKIA